MSEPTTLQRIECQVCGRDVSVTASGLVRAHKTWRISRNGKPYVADDTCTAGGWPVEWPGGERT